MLMTDLRSYYAGRKVLVTGANGFIGAWLVEQLVEHGAEVCGFDMSEQGSLSLHPGLREKISFALGQITDQPLLEQTLAQHGIQTVFHLAANSNLGWAKSNPVSVFESNIKGSWSVLDACRTYGK